MRRIEEVDERLISGYMSFLNISFRDGIQRDDGICECKIASQDAPISSFRFSIA